MDILCCLQHFALHSPTPLSVCIPSFRKSKAALNQLLTYENKESVRVRKELLKYL